MKRILIFLLLLSGLNVQAQIKISKVTGGTILVNNGGREYNLLSSYRLQKSDGKIRVLTDLGGRIDTFDPSAVDTLVLASGEIITSFDLDTLFTQLYSNFFNASGLTGDFFADVSKGLIAGHTAVVISGSVIIPIKDVVNDIWDGTGILEYLASAETLNIKSTLGSDMVGGGGARTVLVRGLGAGLIELVDTINMDGTNNVLTTNAYLYPPTLEVLTAGVASGRVNNGDITAISSSTAKLQSKILAGICVSKSSHFTVPAGKTMLMIKADINATRLSAGQVPNITLAGLTRLAGLDPDAAWVSRTIRKMDTEVLDQLFVDQPINRLLPEGAEFRATAISSEDNTDVRSRFYAILIDN